MQGTVQAARTRRRIVVIDDDDLVRGTVVSILRAAGHETVEAADGDQGLKQLRGGSFDAVITDIMMPQKEGIETIIEIRRLEPDVRILAISGGGSFGSTSFLQWAEKLGAHGVLAKPFSMQQLLQAFDELWEETA